MLYTKFQGHWSVGSGKEDSLKVFTIYGHGGGSTRNFVTFGPVAFEDMFEIVIL